MRKLAIVTIAAGMMISSAVAASIEGKVADVMVDSSGTTKVSFNKGTDSSPNYTFMKPLNGTAEVQKATLAILLTAKAMGATVRVKAATVNGVNVWSQVRVLP